MASTAERPARQYAMYVVFVLFLVNVLGYLDRQILVMLIGPVRAELDLTDGEVGLIHGGAFIITYSVAGMFLGRLVDRVNRRNLLAICVVIWSVLTGLSGLAANGGHLFLARMGVGVGEAALIPAAASIIADYFEPNRRGLAMGVLLTGNYVGTGLSYTLIGGLAPVMASVSVMIEPHGFHFSAWRLCMFVMLGAGLIAALLLFTIREPARAASPRETALADDSKGVSFWFKAWRLYLPHHLGFAFLAFCLFGMHAWTPTAIMRQYGWTLSDTGLVYGVMVATTGGLATLVGGLIGDRTSTRGGAGRITGVPYLVAAGSVGVAVMIAAPSAVGMVVGCAITNFCLGAALAIGVTSVSDIAPARQRGLTTAAYLLFSGIIGSGVAPALIGYLNDEVGGAGGVPLSQLIAWCALGAIVLASGLIYFTLQALRSSRAAPVQ